MPSRLSHAFRALRHRNYRLFFSGQSVSLIGTWMQQLAMSWLVYRLTGSAFILGVIAFATQFPTFLLAPIAGVVADRRSRLGIVKMTQGSSMALVLLLAVLILTDVVQVWHIVTIATLLGIVNGFDVPARQSLLVQLVDGPEDLANAIALNSSMFNMARLVGPAVGGVLIGIVGEGLLFLVNGFTYIGVLSALFAIRLEAPARPSADARIIETLREGFEYAFGSPPIRAILTLLALISLVGVPYVVLLPVFASDVLGGGPSTLGILMSSAGFGALAGALYMASRSTVRGLSRVIMYCTMVFSAGLVLFSLSRNLWLSSSLLFVTGFGVMVTTASINTILQTIVDEDKRGRIMSLYAMAFIGMAPIGSLFGGALANRFGAPVTVLLGGFLCFLTAGWFARQRPAIRAAIRPIYARLGIIPEVASGLQQATELRPKA